MKVFVSALLILFFLLLAAFLALFDARLQFEFDGAIVSISFLWFLLALLFLLALRYLYGGFSKDAQSLGSNLRKANLGKNISKLLLALYEKDGVVFEQQLQILLKKEKLQEPFIHRFLAHMKEEWSPKPDWASLSQKALKDKKEASILLLEKLREASLNPSSLEENALIEEVKTWLKTLQKRKLSYALEDLSKALKDNVVFARALGVPISQYLQKVSLSQNQVHHLLAPLIQNEEPKKLLDYPKIFGSHLMESEELLTLWAKKLIPLERQRVLKLLWKVYQKGSTMPFYLAKLFSELIEEPKELNLLKDALESQKEDAHLRAAFGAVSLKFSLLGSATRHLKEACAALPKQEKVYWEQVLLEAKSRLLELQASSREEAYVDSPIAKAQAEAFSEEHKILKLKSDEDEEPHVSATISNP